MTGLLINLLSMLSVAQTNGWMILHQIKLHSSVRNSLYTQKFLFGLNFASFGNAAAALVVDEFPQEESRREESAYITKRNDFNISNAIIERGVSANYQTYIWLLDGCLKSGSFSTASKLHGQLLKSGYDVDNRIRSLIIEIYVAHGHFDDAVYVFDNTTDGGLSCWNSLLCGLAEKNLMSHVCSLFSRMLAGNISPDESTYSSVLRGCSGDKFALTFVEQIHAKAFRHGFGENSLVCNPLIDFYSKVGSVDSATRVFKDLKFRDNVSWVAMISGFSQNGCEEEGILLFCKMLKSGVMPTPYVLSSVISSCTKIELFELGHQLHALIYKWGFSAETFVCNALVTSYCRCGKLLSSEQVFSQMQHKDPVSYNSLISGLAQYGFSEKSLQMFENMQMDHLKPDCVTVASLLSACASVASLAKGRQLHAYALKAGMSSDIIIEGSLLDLYVKCADVETAHKFFLTTQTENVVLWNVMLVAYGQMGDLNESLRLFLEMQKEGLEPNQYTYPSILRTCTSVGALELGKQIHTQVIKTGFQPNVYVCSVLIDMYAKHEELDTAMKIFRRFSVEDVVSWTAMIVGYSRHDLFVQALKLFEEMQDLGIRSDNVGFSSAISACVGIQALNQGRQIHAQSIISGYSLDLSIGNALVSLYARCGRVDDAYLAFDNIDTKDNISWNGLISGFAQSGYCEEALQVFSRMNQAEIEANMFTYGSVVSAAANAANIKQGQQIHARIIKTGHDVETEASNVLITLYAKCGSLEDAKREFFDMSEKNEVSWNSMITAYSQHGCGNEALKLFEEMKQLGLMPNHVTFVGVLSACSHIGLADVGLSYFRSMSKEHGLVPKPEHYVCMVDILGRAGLLQQARKFIEEMPIKPDAMVWRTLLSACIVHRNIDVGEFAAHYLLELEPEDSATYVLLSNMYALAGRWNYRDQTRQLMKDRGVKKEPGRSWIEVKNSVHAFYVGDKLHPLVDKIYEFLEDLNKRAALIGYVQDRSSLWNETELGQKDPAACVHSEKLAVSFGLLSLTSAIPLRVMKNLRVCNDCHNWIKFVSKISNRTIVVRDAYRFHHFHDGDCSCGDYW